MIQFFGGQSDDFNVQLSDLAITILFNRFEDGLFKFVGTRLRQDNAGDAKAQSLLGILAVHLFDGDAMATHQSVDQTIPDFSLIFERCAPRQVEHDFNHEHMHGAVNPFPEYCMFPVHTPT